MPELRESVTLCSHHALQREIGNEEGSERLASGQATRQKNPRLAAGAKRGGDVSRARRAPTNIPRLGPDGSSTQAGYDMKRALLSPQTHISDTNV